MEGDCFVLVSRASAGHLLESPLKHYANASNTELIKNKNSSVKSIRFFSTFICHTRSRKFESTALIIMSDGTKLVDELIDNRLLGCFGF
jgi:hypothetical protein